MHRVKEKSRPRDAAGTGVNIYIRTDLIVEDLQDHLVLAQQPRHERALDLRRRQHPDHTTIPSFTHPCRKNMRCLLFGARSNLVKREDKRGIRSSCKNIQE
jgi:hypothetical protein